MNLKLLWKNHAYTLVISVCIGGDISLFVSGNTIEGIIGFILVAIVGLLIELISAVQYLIHLQERKEKGEP